MVAHPFIRATCVLIGLLQFADVAFSLVLVALGARMGAGAATIGRILAAGGAGGLAGALLGPAVERRSGPAQVAVVSAWIAALLSPLFLLADRAAALGLVYALLCAVMPVLSVAVVSNRSRQTPDHLQARINGIANRIMSISKPVGSCAAGALLDRAGGSATVLALAGYLGAVALVFTILPPTRRELSIERRRPAAG